LVQLTLRLDGRLGSLVRADACARIVPEGLVGGKVIEIDPGSETSAPVREGTPIASQPSSDVGDVLHQLETTLAGIERGEGSLGKLFKDDELYRDVLRLVRQGRGTMASLKQDADAIKGLPVVRSYVQDGHRILVRPDCSRNRRWFPEQELFFAGKAVLTPHGRIQLDQLAGWLARAEKGADLVVAAYAAPGEDPETARTITQKQSEAVCDYLKDRHGVQKVGWFSRRKLTPLGWGSEPPLIAIPEPRPGVEVIVFVPQG
jgi:hypothetical protein